MIILGVGWGSVQSDTLGDRQAYNEECVVGLLRLMGVAVGGLSVSKVYRLSRSGKEIFYFRVVGPVAAIQSLETQRHMLSSRGWRVGWGMI